MDSDAEVAAARLGRTVGGRWRLERVLGMGGMAAVYEAHDASGGVAAVKILHPEMGMRREVRERFLREGYAANKIGHPGVVQALEHGDRETEVFLAMELLRGETLRARVSRHGKLPLEEVLDYADQVLDVLVAAHAKGVVHRDLKPDNLFVTTEGRIKVLDFGLARLLDSVPGQHQTRTGVALGTLAYMAPEQALGRRTEIDGRVDLFALGATMFRILSGRRVHEAESEAELLMAMASRPAPPLAAVADATPEAVGAVVDLALAFSRDARYPDALTMQGDVRALRARAAPPFASARLSSREQATRVDAQVAPKRTQPMPARPAQHATVPLAAYVPGSLPPSAVSPASVKAPSPAVPVPLAEPAPLSAHAPPSAPAPFSAPVPSRTEPLEVVARAGVAVPAVAPPQVATPHVAVPHVAVPHVAQPHVAATAAMPAAAPAISPPAVRAPAVIPLAPAPKATRRPIGLVLGALLAFAAGGATLWFLMRGGGVGDASDASSVALGRSEAVPLAPAVADPSTAPPAQGNSTPAIPDTAPLPSPAADARELAPSPRALPAPKPSPAASSSVAPSPLAPDSAPSPAPPPPAPTAEPAPVPPAPSPTASAAAPDASASRRGPGRGRRGPSR